MPTTNETTEIARIGSTDWARQRHLDLVNEGLDLAVTLWPKPGHATVHVETHDWVRLRRVLLALPELYLEGER